ncbi:hypothetical protein [Streptomyces sp. CA-132043]|uniref:hypothetical protein n=1 Tax=Streptomyces sp. CA-132043 TaxID=3240048 RepID=UPI003D929546
MAPTDDVTLTPLDGPEDSGPQRPDSSRPDEANSLPAGAPEAPDEPAGANGTDTTGAPSDAPPADSNGTGGGGTEDDDADPPANEGSPEDGDSPSDRPGDDPTPSAPDTGSPALLELSAPALTETDTRWCEKVTLNLRNTGGQPVREGTLTFHTHIIGGLGIDWDTRKSTRDLPTPIPAGATKKHTWKICVDAWRVPLGMHIDTKDVDVDWK